MHPSYFSIWLSLTCIFGVIFLIRVAPLAMDSGWKFVKKVPGSWGRTAAAIILLSFGMTALAFYSGNAVVDSGYFLGLVALISGIALAAGPVLRTVFSIWHESKKSSSSQS